jgi:hypothetical protein
VKTEKNGYTALDYINDAIEAINKRAAEKPGFILFQIALEQLVYIKKF